MFITNFKGSNNEYSVELVINVNKEYSIKNLKILEFHWNNQ